MKTGIIKVWERKGNASWLALAETSPFVKFQKMVFIC